MSSFSLESLSNATMGPSSDRKLHGIGGGLGGGGGGTNTAASCAATASQSWSILRRHARDEITPLRLQELCHDNDRVSSLVAVHNSSEAEGDDDGAGSNRILLADLSRQRMTLDTINHLLRLAAARDVRGFIRRLAWGQNDPDNPVAGAAASSGDHRPQQQQKRLPSRGNPAHNKDGSQSMHMTLRAPTNRGMQMLTADGANALDGVHEERARIARLAEGVRSGRVRGASGMAIRDVVVAGRGVAVTALRFLYEALRGDDEAGRAARAGLSPTPLPPGGGALPGGSPRNSSSGNRKTPSQSTANADGGGVSGGIASGATARRMRFVTSVDPVAASSAVSDLNPASTVVISVALRGNEETEIVTKNLYAWIRRALPSHCRSEAIVSHHFFLVTGNDRLKSNKPDSTFLVPDHSRCEAFITLSAAGLLPLSMVFGWGIADKVLAGAHDMDRHFVDSNPRHNLPVLLALTDVWNDAFLGSSGRVVTPFTEALSAYPAFVAAMESETCGRAHDRWGRRIRGDRACAALVVDGGLRGEYDRTLYQGGRVVPSELVAAMDSQATTSTVTATVDGDGGALSPSAAESAHDDLMCSLFAHADVLAFGCGPGGAPSTSTASLTVAQPSNNAGHFFTSVSSLSSANSFTVDAGGGTAGGGIGSSAMMDVSSGNRPSTVLLCSHLDAFSCGQLVALVEHRSVVAARLWDVDPFSRDVGSSLREGETERLKEKLRSLRLFGGGDDDENDDGGEGNGKGGTNKINLATSTILGHYSSRVHGHS